MAKGCPPGFVRRNGRCVPAPKKGPRDVAPGIPGIQVRNPAGRAGRNLPGEGINNPPGRGPANPRGACPTGYVWDVATKRCVRRRGSDAKAREGCPPGYFWDASAKRCRKKKADPGGCPAGYTWNARQGRCVQDKTCPEGMVFRNGKCEFPDQGYCPDGYHLEAGRCVPNERADCPQGYVWDSQTARCVVDTANPPDDEEEEQEEPDTEHPCGEGTVWDDDLQMCVPATGEDDAKERQNILDLLTGFLRENELPMSLLGFIRDALAQGKSYAQIQAELFETPEFKAAYPEIEMRRQKGYGWIPPAQIRAYRDDARRIAKTVLGIDISNREIAGLIAGDVSLPEWESRLATWKQFQKFGPTVRALFEHEIGPISDDRLFAFFNPDIPTPELERAYENALYRGRPAILGLGVRPEEEAQILRRYGVDVDQAFRGYQGIVSEMPRAERLGFLEKAINANPALPNNGSTLFNDTPFATLFRAIQLGDGDAIRILQDQMQREIARNMQGGGVAFEGGVAAGIADRSS